MSFLKTTAIQHLNASSPTISLSSNGNATFANNLYIRGQTGQVTNPLQIKFSNDYPGAGGASSNTADKMKLVFYDNSPIDIYSIGVGPSADMQYHAYQGTAGQGSHNFYTENLMRMKIDGSGYVTKPYQPHIRGSISRSTQSEGVGNLFYQRSAIGLSFSTDRITVPVAGVYMITWMTIADSNTGRYDANLLINGSTICAALNEANGDGHHQKTLSISVNLSASDYIQFYNQRWYNVNNDPQMWSTLSVTLLG